MRSEGLRADLDGFAQPSQKVGMPTMNLVEAVNSALMAALRADERVVVLGPDVGKLGGVFSATKGLYEMFGPNRVIDTPLAEGGVVGCAIGLALNGIRPVAEVQLADFVYPAFDQVVNELAKLRYRSGGQASAPVVIRTPVGAGRSQDPYPAPSPEAYFIHTAGLKVVSPATPYDAKGLLLSAIADDDPVIFLEPKRAYRTAKSDVPETDYTVPIGQARLVRPGQDVTIVAWGTMLDEAVTAAKIAFSESIDCELIDLRTLWPVDLEAVVVSVRKTGRFVVVHEAPRTCGFGAELVALVAERCFSDLKAPPLRVTGHDTPLPYAFEDHYLPLAPRILKGLRALCRARR